MKSKNHLYEAFDEMERMLNSTNELEVFKNLKEADLISLHHSFGQSIRNELGLWKNGDVRPYFLAIGINHPDDMSGILITSFWRKLNGKKLDLDKQIKVYQDYWETMKRLDKKEDGNYSFYVQFDENKNVKIKPPTFDVYEDKENE